MDEYVSADRLAQAQEVAAAWPDWPEVEVAVVVFVRSRGDDHSDALDRARAAVANGLQQASDFNGQLEVRQAGLPVSGASVTVAGVVELGRAASNGLIRVAPSTRAFR